MNVYTLATHVETMCCSEMQAHLPVTSEEEKNGREEGKKNTHWKVANYSHRNLTLTGWLQPQSRRFCTWNSARCYFWDMTWWRNPRGSDRRRTLIQTPPPPHPLPSAPPVLTAQKPSLSDLLRCGSNKTMCFKSMWNTAGELQISHIECFGEQMWTKCKTELHCVSNANK